MMWIYADDVEGEHIPRIGDIAIVTTTEFGFPERKLGIVKETNSDGVDLIFLPCVDPDDLAFYG